MLTTKLQKAQSIWKYGINHPSYVEWYKSAVDNFNFFSGIGDAQWLPSDIQSLHERGQMPLTFNLLPSFINNLCGVEIQSRFSVGCRIDLSDEQTPDGNLSYSRLSKALTHFLLNWQHLENVSRKGSWKFQDAMICGIAWSAIFKEGNTLKYKYCSPLEVIPDFDDTSPQFDDSKYVLKEWYLSRGEILKRWPKAKSEVDFKNTDMLDEYSKSAALEKYSSTSGFSSNASSVKPLVCEVQHREDAKAYSGITKDGLSFETFDLEQAEKVAGDKRNIEEFNATKIIRTRFIGDCLLDSAPLDPAFPNQQDFSFIPFVWAKTKTQNIPYAFQETLKAIQMDLNRRVANAIHYSQSNQYIIEGGAALTGKDIVKMRREIKNKNSIIQIPVGSKITVNSSVPLGEEQMKIVQQHLALFQRVSGIHDEMLGVQTNATSGIAQKIRQINSVRTNVFSFDALAYMKEREAMVALKIFQNSFFENFYQTLVDGSEIEDIVVLNAVVEDMVGRKRMVNNVSFLPLSLYFEEMHNVVSSLEDIREGAIMISQNPALLQMPSLLKDLGLRHADKYIADMEAQQEKMQQKQNALQQNPANNPNQEEQVAAIAGAEQNR